MALVDSPIFPYFAASSHQEPAAVEDLRGELHMFVSELVSVSDTGFAYMAMYYIISRLSVMWFRGI